VLSDQFESIVLKEGTGQRTREVSRALSGLRATNTSERSSEHFDTTPLELHEVNSERMGKQHNGAASSAGVSTTSGRGPITYAVVASIVTATFTVTM
jgi:hypothetical protein